MSINCDIITLFKESIIRVKNRSSTSYLILLLLIIIRSIIIYLEG